MALVANFYPQQEGLYPRALSATRRIKNLSPSSLRITFVLPGRGRSGGVRVTVEMANRLLKRGHHVRIACHAKPINTTAGMKDAAKGFLMKFGKYDHCDWVQDFGGEVEAFQTLGALRFAKGEIVIAVGTMTVQDVYELAGDVVKLRYCHGISENQPELTRSAWSLPMPTIAVSRTLLPILEELTGSKILDVVPNGINTDEYYEESLLREGIGGIFSSHFLKSPETMLEIMRRAQELWPHVPCYLFGTESKPAGIKALHYTRYPSVEKARELYNRCKIWLLPSRSEGLPAPILEAMACGCAVVSTRQRGSLEVIRDGENGFLVPVDDVDGFLQKIEKLLDNESFRQRIVEAGKKTISRFTWESSVLKMEQCLQRLLSLKNGFAGEFTRIQF